MTAARRIATRIVIYRVSEETQSTGVDYFLMNTLDDEPITS